MIYQEFQRISGCVLDDFGTNLVCSLKILGGFLKILGRFFDGCGMLFDDSGKIF